MAGWLWRRGGGLIALAHVLVSATASAQTAEVPSSLEWSAPAECASAAQIGNLVNEQLGRRAFASAGEVELVVAVNLELRASGHYAARITLLTQDRERLGERQIESDNRECRSLDEALAVTLAILLSATQEELRSRAPSPWSTRVSLAAGTRLGLTPRPGLLLGLGAALSHRRRWNAELSLAYLWSPRDGVAEGKLRVQAASASLGGSVALLLRSEQELRLRLAAEAGQTWARAYGFSRSFTERRPYFGVGGGIEWTRRLRGPLWLELRGSFGWVALRPRFAVRNPDGTLDTLFEPGQAFGSVTGGPALHFD